MVGDELYAKEIEDGTYDERRPQDFQPKLGPHRFVRESHADGTTDSCYLCGGECQHCVDLLAEINTLKRQLAEPLTAGDTSLSHAEFENVLYLARHVLVVAQHPEVRTPSTAAVTRRDVASATLILELVGK